MKWLSWFCIAFLCVQVISARASPSGTLQVVTEHWAPYNYLEDGKVKGSSTTIVRQVLEKAGLSYQISVYPWARSYRMASSQPNILIYSLVRIPPREKLFTWIRPLGSGQPSALFRLKSSKAKPQTLEQAKRWRVVVNQNSMDHTWLIAQGFGQIHPSVHLDQSIQMFMRGRVDLIAADENSIVDAIERFGYDPKRVEKVMTLFEAPMYIAMSLDSDPQLVQRLQRAYDELLADGEIELVN